MKQLNNNETIYLIREIKEKEKEKEKITSLKIENITLDNNNFFGKSNNKFTINLSSLGCQYLSHKLFNDNSMIIVGISCIQLYPNIKDLKNILSVKFSFYYEKQYKIKLYQINQNKYIIINGKSIILIERNKKLLITKTYNRLNNMSIVSIINSEEEKDKFSGFLLKIQCLVSYEGNNKEMNGNINIQNLILPQFENDVIIDFRLIYINLDENRIYKIYKNNLIIFLNKNNIFYYIISKDNKEINKLENFNEIVDYIKVIDEYLFIFYNNTNINIYKIILNKKVEISFLKNVTYNTSNKIILKRKIFYNKKSDIIFIFYIDYGLNQTFLSFNLSNKDTNTNEQKISQINKIYSPNNYIKKKINNTFIYYINKKHSVIYDKSFYNKIIIKFKIYHQITKSEKIISNNVNSEEEQNKSLILLLTNNSEIEIYNFEYNTKQFNSLLYVIYLEFDYTTIIDYLMINENYLLLLNINSDNNILELNKIHLSEIGKKECLLECKMAYNNLYYLQELNILFINSNYGEISVYNIDSEANIEFINSFNYGYSSSEIIKIKNVLTEDDFSKLFIYDLLTNRLVTFCLVDIRHVLKYKENDMFYFHLIIFLYKECFILFIIMENKYTLTNKVLFGKQIKIEKNLFNNIKEPFDFILENLIYDIDNHSFDFNIPQEINK